LKKLKRKKNNKSSSLGEVDNVDNRDILKDETKDIDIQIWQFMIFYLSLQKYAQGIVEPYALMKA
jgi:hypothetical protein